MSDESQKSARHRADSTMQNAIVEDGTVELSASDLEAVEPADAHQVVVDARAEADPETTQVMERRRLEAGAAADAHQDEQSLRTTMQSEAIDEQTTNYDVPPELLEKVTPTAEQTSRLERLDSGEVVVRGEGGDADPKTTKMKSVSTRPMPRVEESATIERTIERTIPGAKVDADGFYTFVARPDADGRIQLPEQVLERGEEGQLVCVTVKTKVVDLSE